MAASPSPKKPRIEDLFRRCVHLRCADAWRELMSGERAGIRRLARAALRQSGRPTHRADVDDLEQEIYCRLLGAGARDFSPGSTREVWSWLGRVAELVVVDLVRRENARKRRPPVVLDGRVGGWLTSIARGADPEAALLRSDDLRRFLEVCAGEGPARLRRLRRRVVRLAFLEGRSSRDVAALVGLSSSAVDVLVHGVRRALARDGLRLPRRPPRAAPAPAAGRALL